MSFIIIENSDHPELAEFVLDDHGFRLIFNNENDALDFISKNATEVTKYSWHNCDDD